MSWLAVLGTALQIIFWALNTWKEANDETKKQRTEVLQSGIRGLVDHDAARITAAFDKLRSLR